MTQRIGRTLILVLLAAFSLVVAAPAMAGRVNAGSLTSGQAYDRFIVRFRQSAPERLDPTARQRLFNLIGFHSGVAITQLRRLAVGADVIQASRKLDSVAAKALMQRLAGSPSIDYVEADTLLKPAAAANDPSYVSQWNLHDLIGGIRADLAWGTTSGGGVVVAVLDSGIVFHSDLSANVIAGYDFISDPAIAGDGNGRDASANDDGDWCDTQSGEIASDWHGTHVAGTIAAVTNNAKGVASVAFGAKVEPVRVLGHCGGYLSDVADAIVWAAGGTVSGVPANANPAEVINLSLSGPGACDDVMQAAVDSATGAGSVVVAAAGNNANDAANYTPGSCDGVITVTGSGLDGQRASYANSGPRVDLAAPGGAGAYSILSTANNGTTAATTESYLGYQGTSMAAAHVSGVAALMQSVRVNTPAAVKAIMKSTARGAPSGCVNGCGYGLVDANAAVANVNQVVLSISNAKIVEGDSGTQQMVFTIALSRPLDVPVDYDISTADATATAGSDYVASSLTNQVIPAGQTSKTFSVTVNGDLDLESNEIFDVSVSRAEAANVIVIYGYAQATGTIIDNDVPDLTNGVHVWVPITNPGDERGYKILIPDGAVDLTVTLNSGGSIYVKYGSKPTATDADCVAATQGLNACTIPMPNEGYYYIVVKGSIANSQVDLVASYQMASVTMSDPSITEGNSGTKTMTFTVSLDRAVNHPVTFDVATSDATASAGSDYVPLNLTGQSIAAGQTSKTFNVTINGDTAIESDELFLLNISNVVGVDVASSAGLGTIVNDDAIPLANGAPVSVPTISRGQNRLYSLVVPAGASNLTFNTSGGTGDADLYVRFGSAPTISTYDCVSRSSTATESCSIPTPQAGTYYVLIIAYSGISGVSLVGQYTPPLLLSIGDASITEGNSGTKVLTFTVHLSQAASTGVTYNIATANGTATSGSDYVANSLNSQLIPAGSLSKPFSVTLNGDTAIEPNETFTVNLSNASGAIISDAQAIGTITNDDLPSLSIGDVAISEGNSGTKVATFTVHLSQAALTGVTYNIATANGTATAGSDYVANSLNNQLIPAGSLSKPFSVTLNGDTTIEPNETFTVNLSNASGATISDAQAIGTITNDDLPSLSIGDVATTEGNTGTKVLTFTVHLSAAAPTSVTYNIATANGTATAGSDYVANSLNNQLIPAGSLSKSFVVTLNGDTTIEPSETFTATISNASGATISDAQAIGTITNDDLPSLSIGDVATTEGNSGTKVLTFTVHLSAAAPTGVTYSIATSNGTATAGSDYVANTLSNQLIPAGNLSKSFVVTLNGDTTVEPNETFTANLSSASGATISDAQAIGTITNDD